MRFAFSPEQDDMRQSIRKFIETRSPITEVRRLMDTPEGRDDVVWQQMGSQLALQGLHIPETYGGQGFTPVELTIVLEEMGRNLVCAPYFASVCLGANAILNAGTDEQKAALLPDIATGATVSTLAIAEPSGRWAPEHIEMAAAQNDDGTWALNGTKSFVLDGHTADVIVVAARVDDSVALWVVPGDAPGLTRTALPTMDQTRKQALLEFHDVPADLLGQQSAASGALTTTLNQAAICMSAEMVGGAQRCLDMSVSYAKERVQFGRLIGSFQSIQHKCADMLVEVESARAVTYDAARRWADGEDLYTTASLAKSYCSDAFFRVAAETIQVHGGLGFTWEHDAHLYFKRAKSSAIILGDALYHREQLAGRLGA